MGVLNARKNEEDPFKDEDEGKIIQAFIGVLATCKNEEDSLKNEGTRMVTLDLPLLIYADFYDAQGKLTPQSEVDST